MNNYYFVIIISIPITTIREEMEDNQALYGICVTLLWELVTILFLILESKSKYMLTYV